MQNEESGRVYAGFFVRFAAYIVDSLIIGAGLLLIKIPIWFATAGTDHLLGREFIFEYSVLDIVYYVLRVCYFALLTYYTGATLGKKLFHLQVISSEDRKPTLFEIAFRESVGRFLSRLIVCAGYIMVGADKRKRGLHDILSDTYVVYEHKVSVAVPAPILVQKIPYGVPGAGVQKPVQNQFVPGNTMQKPAQNQFVPGNTMQKPAQNQFVPGNTMQKPAQNQFVPENAVQNQALKQAQNGQENQGENQQL